MRINLEAIIHTPGASLPFDFSMDLSHVEVSGEKPVTQAVIVSGAVKNTAGALVLSGQAKTELSLRCDRCMKPFCKELTVPLLFLLAQEIAGKDEEEIILLDGNELDIGDLAYTTFLLGMDTKNLCSDDCKGLCPGCGANLNEEACRCKPEADPRWAALSQLLDNTE